jgi:hypothetical protein
MPLGALDFKTTKSGDNLMTLDQALWLSIGAGVLAIVFGGISTQWILKQPAGNSRMQETWIAST